MTLEQFKRIYYMEHYHRVYGRLLGLGIIVPSIAFSVMNWVTPRTKKFLAASSALVVFQVELHIH
jgi:cytochrome c oxidase assembly protein subunit 15